MPTPPELLEKFLWCEKLTAFLAETACKARQANPKKRCPKECKWRER